MKIWACFLLACALTACAIPGSHLNLEAGEKPSVVENQELHSKVNLVPITPKLIVDLEESGKLVNTASHATHTESLSSVSPDFKYKIGVGDILNIVVWDHPELTIPQGGQRRASESGNWVHSDGTIFYPYVGSIQVAGHTVSDVREMLTRKLKKYIPSPQVDVSIALFQSQKINVTGQINQPQSVNLTHIPLTLIEAINRAGGFTPLANSRSVTLIRDNRKQVYSVYDALYNGDLSNNVVLQSGDVVHVPSNKNNKVYVLGEVIEPRSLQMGMERMSLMDAIAEARGLNDAKAKASGVFVFRNNATNEQNDYPTVFQLNAKMATAFLMADQFSMHSGDIVYVTTTPIGRWNRLIRQLTPSFSLVRDIRNTTR